MPKRKEGWLPKEQRSVLKCKECKQEKPRGEFHPHGTSASGLQQYGARCKACENTHADLKWASRGKPKEKSAIIARAKSMCCKCGYDKCSAALDFHHVDSATKLFSIGSGLRLNIHTVEELDQEIEKCVVLCSNCHREYHAGMWTIEEVL